MIITPLKLSGNYILSFTLKITNGAFCIYGFCMILIVKVNKK
jgi:hypothetical protein